MSLVADIYGLSVDEALNLSDREADFLLSKAQTTMMNMATTSPAMQELLRSQLQPTLRTVREARSRRTGDDTGGGGGGGGTVGPPPGY